jgi:hypothetical protein
MFKKRGRARRAVVLDVLLALCVCGLAPLHARAASIDTAEEYYRVARKAIDGGDEAQYRDYLGKAQRELIEVIRRNPSDPRGHLQMGIILVYQGNLDAGRSSFLNALNLHKKRSRGGERGDGIYYTNIAHTDVYRGKLKSARRYLDVGRRRGAPPDEVDRIETLLAWKSGDRTEARDIFNTAREVTRGYADTWDSVPLPQKMKSFEDFCAVCCGNPSCGPHLRDACDAERQVVKEREVTRETLVEEMRLERERQAKLKEIYKGDKNVSIEVEKPESEKSSAPQPAVPPAKPKPAR